MLFEQQIILKFVQICAALSFEQFKGLWLILEMLNEHFRGQHPRGFHEIIHFINNFSAFAVIAGFYVIYQINSLK